MKGLYVLSFGMVPKKLFVETGQVKAFLLKDGLSEKEASEIVAFENDDCSKWDLGHVDISGSDRISILNYLAER